MDDAPPTTHDLIEAWDSGLRGMLDLCETLTDEQWAAPTPCPGWSVADIVAHTIDVEQTVGGYPRPEHALDLVGLPHARGLGELTEIGVDYRRGRPREQVLDELRAVLPVRRGQLDATPAGAEVVGPFLSTMPLERVLRMRIFDIWVHEQDIRAAIGQDGGWGAPAARVALQQMIGALPFVWGKNVKAPAGSTVRVRVTGPELEADVSAVVGDDGRGHHVASPDDPTVTLALSWPDFMVLACGRIDPADPGLRSRIELTGDSALGERLLPALSIAP